MAELLKEQQSGDDEVPELVQKFARPVLDFVTKALPVVIKVSQQAHAAYKKLPIVHVHLIIGTVLCFFGGFYPMFFAALQAAEHGGLSKVGKALGDLSEEVLVIIEQSKKDNKVDADQDGDADVMELDGGELLKRKMLLVMAKMNPEKVNNALTSIYQVWVSVAVVLTIQFAKTVALSKTITNFFKKRADRLLLPLVKWVTPKEYRKWCPVLLDWVCKSIGLYFAWKIQTVISAFASAMSGGLIIARAMLRLRMKNPVETNIDEILSYAFAGMGFYFQYSCSFSTPFPFKIFLFPIEIAEYWIRWSVTKLD